MRWHHGYNSWSVWGSNSVRTGSEKNGAARTPNPNPNWRFGSAVRGLNSVPNWTTATLVHVALCTWCHAWVFWWIAGECCLTICMYFLFQGTYLYCFGIHHSAVALMANSKVPASFNVWDQKIVSSFLAVSIFSIFLLLLSQGIHRNWKVELLLKPSLSFTPPLQHSFNPTQKLEEELL